MLTGDYRNDNTVQNWPDPVRGVRQTEYARKRVSDALSEEAHLIDLDAAKVFTPRGAKATEHAVSTLNDIETLQRTFGRQLHARAAGMPVAKLKDLINHPDFQAQSDIAQQIFRDRAANAASATGELGVAAASITDVASPATGGPPPPKLQKCLNRNQQQTASSELTGHGPDFYESDSSSSGSMGVSKAKAPRCVKFLCNLKP